MGGNGSEPSSAAHALFDLLVEVPRTFFRLRAAGQRLGAVSKRGGGTWGFLRSLSEDGPQTVPQLARSRPVARQHIQVMANELVADGLIEFVDNPAHRRSRLMRLTPAGEGVDDEMTRRLEAWCAELSVGFDERELRAAIDVLARLRQRLE